MGHVCACGALPSPLIRSKDTSIDYVQIISATVTCQELLEHRVIESLDEPF